MLLSYICDAQQIHRADALANDEYLKSCVIPSRLGAVAVHVADHGVAVNARQPASYNAPALARVRGPLVGPNIDQKWRQIRVQVFLVAGARVTILVVAVAPIGGCAQRVEGHPRALRLLGDVLDLKGVHLGTPI